jgi:hypothetical protein
MQPNDICPMGTLGHDYKEKVFYFAVWVRPIRAGQKRWVNWDPFPEGLVSRVAVWRQLLLNHCFR